MLLFTGKGGVGKTTVAAATAVHAARAGRRVLVTSTDPAHSLADALDTAVDDAPTPVAPNLDAQQIDAQQRLERHWREVRDYLVSLLAWGGVGDLQAEEMVLLPGLDELFALIDLNAQAGSGAYDLIVVDCAPTAETLRLLSLPDALRWYVDRILGPGRRLARAMRPLTRGVGPGGGPLPIPDDHVFSTVERVDRELAAVHRLLRDTGSSTLRLVVNPERLVVAETERMATSLSLFGYGVDAVVVNRLLPDQVVDPYLARWKLRHAEHLEAVSRGFAPTPVLRAPLFDDEPTGIPALHRLASTIYADRDPVAILHDVRPVQVHEDEGGYVLTILLPFAHKDDLELNRRGADLHVRVGGTKRTVPLPAALQRTQVTGARLRDGRLQVRFRPTAPAVEQDDRAEAST